MFNLKCMLIIKINNKHEIYQRNIMYGIVNYHNIILKEKQLYFLKPLIYII